MRNLNRIASLSVVLVGLPAVLIAVGGCMPDATKQKPAANPDPVVALKEIVAGIESNGQKYGYVASDIAYDVQKTDSLVSPYTATVKFRSRNMTGQPGWDKDFHFHMIAKLAQQDGKWVIKDVERHLDPLSDQQRMERDMLRDAHGGGAAETLPDVERHSDGTNNKEINAWWRAFGEN